ncbi:protein of unknown function [Bradyrhizobium sp. ORS 285]|nr:hypothetical protein BRAO285_2130009 [Bradyrhizobium sp. ORS 285]SMX56208.1 protein of unknown function [Bradyrhizobium sp. ORS 285]
MGRLSHRDQFDAPLFTGNLIALQARRHDVTSLPQTAPWGYGSRLKAGTTVEFGATVTAHPDKRSGQTDVSSRQRLSKYRSSASRSC